MKCSYTPLVLSFRYSEVKEFRMYSGTKDRTKVCDTSLLNPQDLWPDEITKQDSFYKDMMLIFVDDAKLSILPYNYSFSYRLENRIIKIYSHEHSLWIPFAYTDGQKVVLKLGLSCLNNIKRRIVNYDETESRVLDYAGLSSIHSLKGLNTEIAWCNIHYIFQ